MLLFESSRWPVGQFHIYDIINDFNKPLYSTPWEIETLHGYYLDKNYLYVKVNIFNNDTGQILKIYDLNTLAEVFSQEIK